MLSRRITRNRGDLSDDCPARRCFGHFSLNRLAMGGFVVILFLYQASRSVPGVGSESYRSLRSTTTSTTGMTAEQLKHRVMRFPIDESFPLNPNKQLATFQKPDVIAGTKIWVHDPKECMHISGGLLKNGAWEDKDQRNLMKFAPPNKKKNGGETPLFVDIGGNLGAWSMAMAAAGYQVEAFEPLLYNVELFSHSIRENNFQNKIKLFRVAVGETPKPKVCLAAATTSSSSPNMGNGRIREDSNNDNNNDHLEEESSNCVPMVRVDSLVSRCPDLVKVDVEGHEVSALISLGVSVEGTCRPKAIALEDNFPSSIKHLKSLGYTCYRIGAKGNPDYVCHI